MTGSGGLLFVAVVLLSGWVCPALLSAADDLPIAATPLGLVQGKWAESRSGRKYAEFGKIPYAKPPLGSLRLQAPEPAEPWEEVRDGTEEMPVCPQPTFFAKEGAERVLGTEDCLYLSVSTHDIYGKAPVLVNIHGGAFIVGGGRQAKATYLMDEDLVIVNINYRLGILGFLTWETDELRGNQGLKDQAMALRWVQENIASFGGDPELVTIIGMSAGGASVHFQTVSPLSRGLFQRAISESGTSYSPWALAPPGSARARTEKLMGLIGCPTSPKEAIPCLLEKDAAQLINMHYHFLEFQFDPMNNFIPSLEPPGPEAFLSGPFDSWTPASVPMIMGFASAEGLMRSLMLLENGTNLKWFSDKFDDVAPMSILYEESAPNPREITEKIKNFYFLNREITIDNWVNLTNIYSDAWFDIPVKDGASKHTGKVYFYVFDYLTKEPFHWAPFPQLSKGLNFGADHCAEAMFLWDVSEMVKHPNTSHLNDAKDLTLSRKLVKAVANFAKIGAPEAEMAWKPWTETKHHYIQIDRLGEFIPKEGLAEERYGFWKSIDYRGKFDRTPVENLASSCTPGKVVQCDKNKVTHQEL